MAVDDDVRATVIHLERQDSIRQVGLQAVLIPQPRLEGGELVAGKLLESSLVHPFTPSRAAAARRLGGGPSAIRSSLLRRATGRIRARARSSRGPATGSARSLRERRCAPARR